MKHSHKTNRTWLVVAGLLLLNIVVFGAIKKSGSDLIKDDVMSISDGVLSFYNVTWPSLEEAQYPWAAQPRTATKISCPGGQGSVTLSIESSQSTGSGHEESGGFSFFGLFNLGGRFKRTTQQTSGTGSTTTATIQIPASSNVDKYDCKYQAAGTCTPDNETLACLRYSKEYLENNSF